MAAAMREGDWICPSCANHNYANKVVCNRCAMPNTNSPGKAAGLGKGGGYGKAAAPQALSGKGRGMPYGKPAVSPMSLATTTGMRPGDWLCPLCGNHNYANRATCNRCQSGAGGGKGMLSFDGENKRPGDWECFGCGNHNFANREACNKCGVSKTVFIGPSGVRPGDWICPHCENHNYADKTHCNKCAIAKGNTVACTGNMKEGDWLCPMCQNHNYKDKLACNRCQVPREQTGV